ncbi:hypothetical protein D3C74_441670 [compost metagenome]
MILTENHAGDMRCHQADKTDRADKGHRQRGKNTDAQQGREAQATHVDTEAHRPILAQPQRGQLPGAHHRQCQQHGEHAQQDAQLVP